MSQTIQLTSHGKFLSQGSAQVIALDPRPLVETESSVKYFRVLQLSDLLSRHLDIDQVVKIFMAEIADEINYCGYRFVCEDLDTRIEQGDVGPSNAQYRLKNQNQLLGELTLFRRSKFNSGDLCELEDLMCALVHPVKNALMYQVALKSAYLDPLTGLNNRTCMEKNLPREIELAKRHKQSMAILVMDLDGFKRVNDSCGHDAGDEVLRQASRVISQAVRNTDLVYRYGGDEFVGGLTQTDIKGAADVSERIRSNIDALHLGDIGDNARIQVSIGITLVRDRDSFLTAFKRADKALFQAKLSGKNQIITC